MIPVITRVAYAWSIVMHTAGVIARMYCFELSHELALNTLWARSEHALSTAWLTAEIICGPDHKLLVNLKISVNTFCREIRQSVQAIDVFFGSSLYNLRDATEPIVEEYDRETMLDGICPSGNVAKKLEYPLWRKPLENF